MSLRNLKSRTLAALGDALQPKMRTTITKQLK
jgi:hypothetical protein